MSTPSGQNALATLSLNVVQDSLVDASATVTGMGSRVSRETEKLRTKIWKDEYIEFGSLLANPIFADQYQLTVQNAESGSVPSLCIEPLAKLGQAAFMFLLVFTLSNSLMRPPPS